MYKVPVWKARIVNQKMGGARALQYRAFHFTYCEINSQNLLRIQLNAACAEEGMVKMEFTYMLGCKVTDTHIITHVVFSANQKKLAGKGGRQLA